MSDLDLDRLQAMADATTEGPWYEDDNALLSVEQHADGSPKAIAEQVYMAADRAFIVEARTAMPKADRAISMT